MNFGNSGSGFVGDGGFATAFRRWDHQRPEFNMFPRTEIEEALPIENCI